MMLKQNRQLLDYNYDTRLSNYHESYDEDEEDIDISFLKKEEKQEVINYSNVDEECFITEQDRDRGVSLFEGINLPRNMLDVDDPLKSSSMRETQFMPIGQKKKDKYWESKKDRFVCESGSADVQYNEHIIKVRLCVLELAPRTSPQVLHQRQR